MLLSTYARFYLQNNNKCIVIENVIYFSYEKSLLLKMYIGKPLMNECNFDANLCEKFITKKKAGR